MTTFILDLLMFELTENVIPSSVRFSNRCISKY